MRWQSWKSDGDLKEGSSQHVAYVHSVFRLTSYMHDENRVDAITDNKPHRKIQCFLSVWLKLASLRPSITTRYFNGVDNVALTKQSRLRIKISTATYCQQISTRNPLWNLSKSIICSGLNAFWVGIICVRRDRPPLSMNSRSFSQPRRTRRLSNEGSNKDPHRPWVVWTEHACHFGHPWTRPVNTGSVHGPLNIAENEKLHCRLTAWDALVVWLKRSELMRAVLTAHYSLLDSEFWDLAR